MLPHVAKRLRGLYRQVFVRTLVLAHKIAAIKHVRPSDPDLEFEDLRQIGAIAAWRYLLQLCREAPLDFIGLSDRELIEIGVRVAGKTMHDRIADVCRRRDRGQRLAPLYEASQQIESFVSAADPMDVSDRLRALTKRLNPAQRRVATEACRCGDPDVKTLAPALGLSEKYVYRLLKQIREIAEQMRRNGELPQTDG